MRKIVIATGLLLLPVLASYLLLLRTYRVEEAAIPCLAGGGPWLYVPTAGGWAVSEHKVGDAAARKRLSASPPAILDCDPVGVGEGRLMALENGTLERVELRRIGNEWELTVQNELTGVYSYRYRYERAGVVVVAATKRLIGLNAAGVVLLITLVALAGLARLMSSGAKLHV